jgi:hypothetical protein
MCAGFGLAQAINILLSKLPSVEELQECIANFDEDKLNAEAIEMLFKNQPTAEARAHMVRVHATVCMGRDRRCARMGGGVRVGTAVPPA